MMYRLVYHQCKTVLTPVLHQMWEVHVLKVRAYNEVLVGELQPEVDLLQGVEENWVEEDGSERKEELGVAGSGR